MYNEDQAQSIYVKCGEYLKEMKTVLQNLNPA